MEFKLLGPPHEDIITDISFDYYGTRFATCSSDRSIRVWTLLEDDSISNTMNSNMNIAGSGNNFFNHNVNNINNIPSDSSLPMKSKSNFVLNSSSSPLNSSSHSNSSFKNSNWHCDDIAKAHSGIIWRIAWAHPEYGSLLASAGEDGCVKIWEEKETPIMNTFSSNSYGPNNIKLSTNLLNTSKESMNITNNNKTPHNLPHTTAKMDKARWIKRATPIESSKSINDLKFANKSLGLILGCVSADGYIRIYEARDVFNLSQWESMIEYKVDEATINAQSTSKPSSVTASKTSPYNEHGLTALAWSNCSFESPRIVVGGYGSSVLVYRVTDNNLILECVFNTHKQAISDLVWAPLMGRSCHLIASASREESFQIHTLQRNLDDGSFSHKKTEILTSPSSLTAQKKKKKKTKEVIEINVTKPEFECSDSDEDDLSDDELSDDDDDDDDEDEVAIPSSSENLKLLSDFNLANTNLNNLSISDENRPLNPFHKGLINVNPNMFSNSSQMTSSSTTSSFSSQLPQNVCRLSFNATGTALVSSCDDGGLHIWRRVLGGEWTYVQQISVNNRLSYVNF